MSYLQMKEAPIEDADKMIISFWFRDVDRTVPPGSTYRPPQPKADPPAAVQWQQGFWTQDSKTMVPPNAQYSISNDPAFKNCVFYWNGYGLPTGGLIFGDLFMGPAACWIPGPPPLATNTMAIKPGGKSAGGIADEDMSKFGIRTLLCFGDDKIPYNYCNWHSEDPGVIDAVEYSGGFLGAAGIVGSIHDPPYANYFTGIGDNGHFHVRNYRIEEPKERTTVKVPQSFIGIDKDGYIIINLQTKTKADMKGLSWELTGISELWAEQTHLVVDGPPYSYTQIGFPFPDGHWVRVGGYWNGYEFEYEDISDKIMSCVPEAFLLCGRQTGLFDFAFDAPVIKDGGWHHLLLSFDISGAVHSERPSVPDYKNGTLYDEITWTPGDPNVSSSCKAWLAVDDKNIKGNSLQNRPPIHDGFTLPKLRGTETSQLLDCGPNASYSRSKLNLDDNEILTRNAFLAGWAGNPKDGLLGFSANVGIVDTNSSDAALAYSSKVAVADFPGIANGDFNPIPWTGAIWPLYGHGVAPGPWEGICDPPRPTKPYPRTTFTHPIYDCSGFQIPLKGTPIGVPCSVSHEENNTGVEMAELQIWVGKSLDLGDEKNRRLFIDWPKDQKGNPDKTKPMIPVRTSFAEQALGKPTIRLHGTANWKKGKNSGTSGYIKDKNGKDVPNPAGQFEPIAKIEKFLPDPKLHQ